MAFATSNVRLGSAGDFFALSGNWTGSSGDASGTLSVGGAMVTEAVFYNFDNSSQEDRPTPVSSSTNTTNGVTTLTVHNHSNVTNGVFRVIYR